MWSQPVHADRWPKSGRCTGQLLNVAGQHEPVRHRDLLALRARRLRAGLLTRRRARRPDGALPAHRPVRRAEKKAKIAAMRRPATSTVRTVWLLATLSLCTLALGCGSNGKQTGGTGGTGGGGGNSATTTETLKLDAKSNNEVDILFVLADWAQTEEQTKLYDQIPLFLQVLEQLPSPPNLHIAVVTADMGAPGDQVGQGGACTATGDAAVFQNRARGLCTDTTLTSGATFVSDDGGGNSNFTGQLSSVLQCIALVGDSGCGIPQPLAAMDHALGADNVVNGAPTPPAANAGFLRPEAYLAVVFLSNQDDCSAPANTQLFSLNGGQQNLTNPLGPLTNYRCNQFGHLCKDPAAQNPSALLMPPLNPPSDAHGSPTAPTLDLTSCQDDDTGNGMLTPVAKFVADIKALKPDPDSQILVASISAPPTPYTVAWVPATDGQNTQPGELWPQIEHSCGAGGADDVNPEATMNPTDGSFGDPGVRLAAFVGGFHDSLLASICDASYAASMQATATKIGQLFANGGCLTGTIQQTASALPNCQVVAQVASDAGATKSVTYQNCLENGNLPPCWSLTPATTCNGEELLVNGDPTAPFTSVTVSCQVCKYGGAAPGC